MIELCRHLFLDGRFCRGAAVKDTFFCRHHNSVRKTLTQPRRPATCGMHQLLPFAYPEDRKAILLNLFLVQNALNEGAIDPRRANALTNVIRAQMLNLARIEKIEAPAQQIQNQAQVPTGSQEPCLAAQPAIHQIYEMSLTPEGEEVASPRHAESEETDDMLLAPDTWKNPDPIWAVGAPSPASEVCERSIAPPLLSSEFGVSAP